MTVSAVSTIGNSMSNTTIYGGNFKDVLKSGRDSMRDKDNLKSIAVSTLGAGITSGLSKYIDSASGGIISKGTMQGASFKYQTFSALLENGLSNSVNVALESSISGDSFKESLKRQGLNILSGTIETLGAKYIGNNYHNNEFSDNKVINKTTQLTLHAGLGAITSKISGGDYLNGAVSGVVGEVVGELVFNKLNENSANKSGVFTIDQFNQNKETSSNIAGLFGGLSSIIISKTQGQDIEDITTNAYVGQRIGENAAKYNATNVFSRDLNSILTLGLGTHDGIVISNESLDYMNDLLNSVDGANEKFKIVNLGGDLNYAIITGAGSTSDSNGNLIVFDNTNNQADIDALREYTGLNYVSPFKPDYSTEVTRINFKNNLSEFENDRNVLQNIMNSDFSLKTNTQKYNPINNNCIKWVIDIINKSNGNYNVEHSGIRPGKN